ncbi:MAG: metallophosphoesterase family protein [Thermodesulfovibrionales bacterium]
MKSLVIGDIHGMYEELMRALELSGYSDSDRLIVLGDVINRGERSREVMEFLIEAKRRNPENVYLRGNHEKVLLSALAGKPHSLVSFLDSMYGRESVQSYDKQVVPWGYEDPEGFIKWVFPEEHLQLIREMPEMFDEGKYRFIHDAQDIKNNGKIIIHAHEHNHRPVFGYLRICLGLDDRVAVLDLGKMLIHDSDGVEYEVDMKKVLRELYAEYW